MSNFWGALHKKVRLCKIKPFYPQSTADGELADIQSLETLRNLAPIDMLKQIYLNKNHTEMPEELTPLLEQAIREAEQEKEAQP